MQKIRTQTIENQQKPKTVPIQGHFVFLKSIKFRTSYLFFCLKNVS